jgi:hypothetical protein
VIAEARTWPQAQRQARPPRCRAKKSPAVRRGKTDSLEISQRGKTRIYTKFMMRRKRKKKKNRALSNVKYAEISSSGGVVAKRDVMPHNFHVSRVIFTYPECGSAVRTYRIGWVLMGTKWMSTS